MGQNLFYLAGMCNALKLDLEEIIARKASAWPPWESSISAKLDMTVHQDLFTYPPQTVSDGLCPNFANTLHIIQLFNGGIHNGSR